MAVWSRRPIRSARRCAVGLHSRWRRRWGWVVVYQIADDGLAPLLPARSRVLATRSVYWGVGDLVVVGAPADSPTPYVVRPATELDAGRAGDEVLGRVVDTEPPKPLPPWGITAVVTEIGTPPYRHVLARPIEVDGVARSVLYAGKGAWKPGDLVVDYDAGAFPYHELRPAREGDTKVWPVWG